MSIQTDQLPSLDRLWESESAAPVRARRRRARGLAFPVLPSWPLLAQVGGGVGALVGVYLRFGPAVALIVGGAALVLLGMLREAGKI